MHARVSFSPFACQLAINQSRSKTDRPGKCYHYCMSVASRRNALQTTLTDPCSVALRKVVLQTTLSEQQRSTTGCRLQDTCPSDANINVLSQFAVGSLGSRSGALHIQLHSIELETCSQRACSGAQRNARSQAQVTLTE